MSQQAFDFTKFVEDSKSALLNPKEYFSTMSTEGGLVSPIIKALIYGAIAGFLYMIWSFLSIGAIGGGMLGGAVGVLALFAYIIFAIVGLFIGGLIILAISSISEGSKDFETCVHVSAALMVIMPISALLTIFSGLSSLLGSLISLGLNLYALFMLFQALIGVLKGNVQTAKIIVYILGGLLILFSIIGMATRRAVRSFRGVDSRRMERRLRNLENIGTEIAADYEKVAREMVEEFEKAAEEVAHVAGETKQSSKAKTGKPEAFPKLACKYYNDLFKQSEPALSEELIIGIINATNELKALEDGSQEDALAILNENGFNDQNEYTQALTAATCGFMAIGGLQATEVILESSDAEQDMAEAFELDRAVEGLVKQMINTGNLTEEDIHTVYNNWELFAELDGMVR